VTENLLAVRVVSRCGNRPWIGRRLNHLDGRSHGDVMALLRLPAPAGVSTWSISLALRSRGDNHRSAATATRAFPITAFPVPIVALTNRAVRRRS
jgi:hypothetical protein